jgi:hypothetical protein
MLHNIVIYAIRYARKKISFVLHVHKFRMVIMCVERKID